MLNSPPTSDLQAYDLYLQARALSSMTGQYSLTELFSNGRRAIKLLEEAVARDPNFVPAYCLLAQCHDLFYINQNVSPPEERVIDHRSLGEVALEKARRLQPDSGEVHLALALHAVRITRDSEEAGRRVQLARQTLPNNSEVEAIAGRVARRRDRWDEALRCLERAASLEPRDAGLRAVLADTYRRMRRYGEFDRHFAAALALTPSDQLGELPVQRALGHLEASADLAPLRAAVASQTANRQLDKHDTASAEMTIAVWSHDAAAISRVLATKQSEVSFNGIFYPDSWFEALAARMRGDSFCCARSV